MKATATALFALLVLASAAWPADTPAGWTPDLFQNASTIEFFTTNAAGDQHWSRVWVVVIDGAPYVRLGSASTERVNGNVNSPYVNIRVGGQEFDHVKLQSAPEMKDKIMAAMADKYTTDILARLMPHELFMRLVPAPPTAATH